MHIRFAVLTSAPLWLVASPSAQSPEPKQKAPNESEVILQDFQNQHREMSSRAAMTSALLVSSSRNP